MKIKKRIEKFREPRLLFSSLEASSQNICALVLREISKIKGGNKKRAENQLSSELNEELKKTYSFSNDELCNALDCKDRNLSKTILPAAKGALGYVMAIKDDKGGFKAFSMFEKAEYNKENGLVIKLTDSGRDFLDIQVDKSFAEMNFKLLVSFKSKYTKRLLKLLHSFKNGNTCFKKLSIDEYKDQLMVESSTFSRAESFKRRAITEAFRELIEKSNGEWVATDSERKGYELIKKGRSNTHIKICMRHAASEATTEQEKQVNDRSEAVAALENQILSSNDKVTVSALKLGYVALVNSLSIEPLDSVIEHCEKLGIE